MAQRVQILLEDDIDGTEAIETVQFGLDGVAYEIDLSGEHAAQLRENLATWVGHARKVGGARQGRRAAGGTGKAAIDREQLNKMREWGRANGYQVSDRGRVSQALQDAYHQAH
ncbi:Lsr2 family protein [Allobranchiibius sp. CTAmp26]|uniref:histone-like nucleoid-structuring protein Lsr2 n=1 Tax=Allobranchiibius sp. CTAmp26 TaxID=2815214 RepID=UPI001AA187F3|nr:Lsr2 family protein [Allobranchiibius sp. CTAmp26]MBO1756869.1 Lsr2 family protein [Allobranchiibius sp. CTAmp26]